MQLRDRPGVPSVRRTGGPEGRRHAGPDAPPQTVAIRVERGYRPTRSVALAGRPLRLVFQRRDADPCTERLVISAPHVERRLAPGGTTVVDLPAQPTGVLRFTSGMGRYRGEVRLVDPAPDPASRLGIGHLLVALVASAVPLLALAVLLLNLSADVATLIVAAGIVLTVAARRVRRVRHPVSSL